MESDVSSAYIVADAVILADKKLGPQVYLVPEGDPDVPFDGMAITLSVCCTASVCIRFCHSDYLILERIDGWTLGERIQLWEKDVNSLRAQTDNSYALTLVKVVSWTKSFPLHFILSRRFFKSVHNSWMLY